MVAYLNHRDTIKVTSPIRKFPALILKCYIHSHYNDRYKVYYPKKWRGRDMVSVAADHANEHSPHCPDWQWTYMGRWS